MGFPIIAFEGIDGCGKSTLAAEFAKLARGVLLKQPGPEIYALLDRGITPKASDFNSSREKVIATALDTAKRTTVVMDRTCMSTAAYNMQEGVIGADITKFIVNSSIHLYDVVFLLRPPTWEVAQGYISNIPGKDPIESNREMLETAYHVYYHKYGPVAQAGLRNTVELNTEGPNGRRSTRDLLTQAVNYYSLLSTGNTEFADELLERL